MTDFYAFRFLKKEAGDDDMTADVVDEKETYASRL